jgi:hypothetical protein
VRKEHVGIRGIANLEDICISTLETSKPKLSQGRSRLSAESHVDEIRTYGSGFSRDSIGSPRSRFGSKVNFERSLKTGRSGAETLRGMLEQKSRHHW